WPAPRTTRRRTMIRRLPGPMPPRPHRSASSGCARGAGRVVMSRRNKILIIVVVAVIAIGVIVALWARSFMNRNRVPVTYADVVEHFKYGSIGTEKRLGVPAPLFDLFPVMFADL